MVFIEARRAVHLPRYLALAAMLIVVAACGSNDKEGDGTNKSNGDGDQVSGTKNLIETAQADSRFSVLVEALTAADLVDALSAPGAMTVFAPTNDAFTALLSELGLTKTELLNNKTVSHRGA